jgi:hypothetical protein
MAIALEFIDFIVPITVIRKKFPGGWEQCQNDHGHLIGGCVRQDDHLFRDGVMNPIDIGALVEKCADFCFEPTVKRSG